MVGVKSNFHDADGRVIYSGQRLQLKDPEAGKINISFPVSWSKYNGFRFKGLMLDQYMLDKYIVVKDISWFQKITPKWI